MLFLEMGICLFLCFVKVHDRYVLRLRRKVQFEESRQANQRKVLLLEFMLFCFFGFHGYLCF